MMLEQLDELLHEWHTEKAQRLLKELGTSRFARRRRRLSKSI